MAVLTAPDTAARHRGSCCREADSEGAGSPLTFADSGENASGGSLASEYFQF